MPLKTNVMGVQFDNCTMDEILARAEQMLLRREKGYCVTPNAEIVYEAIHDEAYRDLLNGAAIVLPDGAGVVLGAKILGRPLKAKVPGIEFGDHLCRVLASHGMRLFLLGGKPGVAEAAGEKLKEKHPGLTVCGTADGYFQDPSPVIAAVNAAKPDVLFVCLGAPKQEIFMATQRDALDVTLMAGLGGSLDGYAGLARRAPRWMISCNLEWLYRLLKEPKRFVRMLRLPKFVFACVAEKRKEKKNG